MFPGANIYPKSYLTSPQKPQNQISPPFAIIGHLPLDHSKHAIIDPMHQDPKHLPTDWNIQQEPINISNTPHKPLSHSLSAPEKKIYIFRRKKPSNPRTQSLSSNCLEHPAPSRIIKRSGSCTETLTNPTIACNWERNIYPPIQENATEPTNILSPTKIRREGSFKESTPRSVQGDNFTRPSPLEQSYSGMSGNTGNAYTSLTNSLPISQSHTPPWNPHTSKASLPAQLYPTNPIEPSATQLRMQKGEMTGHGLPVTYHAISSEPSTPSLLPLHRSCEDLLHPTNSPLSEYSVRRESLPSQSLLNSRPNLTQSTSSLHYTPNPVHYKPIFPTHVPVNFQLTGQSLDKVAEHDEELDEALQVLSKYIEQDEGKDGDNSDLSADSKLVIAQEQLKFKLSNLSEFSNSQTQVIYNELKSSQDSYCGSEGNLSPSSTLKRSELTDDEISEKLKKEQQRRKANNERERVRVRDINYAFRELGDICANHTNERAQTKLTILQQALSVIHTLEGEARLRNVNLRAACFKRREDQLNQPCSPDYSETPLSVNSQTFHQTLESTSSLNDIPDNPGMIPPRDYTGILPFDSKSDLSLDSYSKPIIKTQLSEEIYRTDNLQANPIGNYSYQHPLH
ncbi:bHLH domain containing transcription factor E12/E47 [Oopsacas minuta]|uniref:BHLH domain containing transcription factor E12/E47 n=1 Tax=Oopsacas minuta TaxID=111878 RepID=A0AAV7JSV4_9METZ|nr:bHLH domain containing transcription factor E12/E47 [Oopsacas minuta]